MSGSHFLYVGNHNIVGLRGLKNSQTGVADTTATVTLTLKDIAGNEVAGQVWPATMTYGADSEGVAGYYATLNDDIAISDRRSYTAHIAVTGTGGEVATWVTPLPAKTRVA